MNRAIVVFSCMLCWMCSCKKENMGDCLKSTGIDQKKVRQLDTFTRLNLGRRLEVELVHDTVNFVEIAAGNNLLEGIESRVENGVLSIENNNRCNWVRSYERPVKIVLHSTSLSHIFMETSSNIKSSDTLRFPVLKVELFNSAGDISLMVENEKTEIIQHTGASDIIVNGKSQNLIIYMADLCFGDYTGLTANYVYVSTKSSASVRVQALDEFNFRILGDGDIFYKGPGNPVILEKTGKGNAVKIL